ncbi:MAG: hypothetical protein JWN52_5474 [Actinomycetia bacterium]|nr:hypothetical protein [Actinomycetes bacterium]
MTTWRKSSHSDAHGNDCVEVADLAGAIGIRDSKNPDRPHLSLTTDAFASLVKRVKHNRLNG